MKHLSGSTSVKCTRFYSETESVPRNHDNVIFVAFQSVFHVLFHLSFGGTFGFGQVHHCSISTKSCGLQGRPAGSNKKKEKEICDKSRLCAKHITADKESEHSVGFVSLPRIIILSSNLDPSAVLRHRMAHLCRYPIGPHEAFHFSSHYRGEELWEGLVS